MQPRLRALPVELRPTGPARAVDRRVPRAGRRVPAHADLLREHRRRRADGAAGLLGDRRLRHGARRGREVLDERLADHAGDRRPPGRQRLRRRADLARRGDGPGQRPRPGRRLLRDGGPGHGAPERRGLRGLQGLGGRHARERRPARRVQGHRRPLRRAAAAHAAAAVRARRRRLGRAPSNRRAATAPVPLAARPRGGGADRRLVLPSRRVRRPAARPQPVRRRPRRVPRRPGRRRVCVPVRHPRGVPGRQRPQSRRFRDGVARVGAVPGPAQAADQRRVPVVLAVRRLPRRLHGREVLHRAAARRPGPGVRAGPRRVAARTARRPRGPAARARPLAPQAVASGPGLRREPAGRARGPLSRKGP